MLAIIAFLGTLMAMRSFVADLAIVDGRSMMPGFRPGDVALIFKAAYGFRGTDGRYHLTWKRPSPRDVVAAVRPDTGTYVIKRVREIFRTDSADMYFLLGDNLGESVDSREFGPVSLDLVVGKAFMLLHTGAKEAAR